MSRMPTSLLRITCFVGLLAWLTTFAVDPARAEKADKGPVKVFLLVGQSNMEGKGRIKHLEELIRDSKTAQTYKHLKTRDGKWVVRDDVWIWYLGRTGGLTVGYGSRGDQFGPELQFGHVVGDHLDNQVLLIKIAWGGRSLGKDFRPPSSGGQTGPAYLDTIKHTREVLGNLKSLFPDYHGEGYELAGLVWFQGWNDRINQALVDQYEENLANLIRDLRKELGVPNLPVVIGETGQGGPEEKHPRALALMKAQAAVAQLPELKDHVAFASTRNFWESEPRFDGGYHWFGNAVNFFQIGEAFGKAMVELLEKNGSAR